MHAPAAAPVVRDRLHSPGLAQVPNSSIRCRPPLEIACSKLTGASAERHAPEGRCNAAWATSSSLHARAPVGLHLLLAQPSLHCKLPVSPHPCGSTPSASLGPPPELLSLKAPLARRRPSGRYCRSHARYPPASSDSVEYPAARSARAAAATMSCTARARPAQHQARQGVRSAAAERRSAATQNLPAADATSAWCPIRPGGLPPLSRAGPCPAPLRPPGPCRWARCSQTPPC